MVEIVKKGKGRHDGFGVDRGKGGAIKGVKHRNWTEIREDWIESHLRGQPKSLSDVADEQQVLYTTVRKYSSTGKWSDLLKERTERQGQLVSDQVELHHQQTMATLRGAGVNDEVHVRSRQADCARLIQQRAMERIRSIDPRTLTAKEAMELLRLGLEQERIALGFDKTYRPSPTSEEEVIEGEFIDVDSFTPAVARQLVARLSEVAKADDAESSHGPH